MAYDEEEGIAFVVLQHNLLACLEGSLLKEVRQRLPLVRIQPLQQGDGIEQGLQVRALLAHGLHDDAAEGLAFHRPQDRVGRRDNRGGAGSVAHQGELAKGAARSVLEHPLWLVRRFIVAPAGFDGAVVGFDEAVERARVDEVEVVPLLALPK